MTSAAQPDDTRLRTRLTRANEMIEGAVAELAAGRFNNAVNRAYYACFHIGVGLRMLAGDEPERLDQNDGWPLWSHTGTMTRLRQLLSIRDLQALDPSPTLILYLRLRADYYTESAKNSVSLEVASQAVLQATRLRETTSDILPWVSDGYTQ